MMGKTRIKKIKKTRRVPCDDMAYEDGDKLVYPREGQWVDVRKKTSGQNYATLLRIVDLFPDDDDVDEDALDDAARAEYQRQNAEALREMINFLPDVYALLAHKITAWNWTDIWDDDEPPLPEPTAETMATLDLKTDLMNLVMLVMEAEETPKN